MFQYKFLVDTNRKNSLVLRLTNNRKKAEIGLGFKWSPDDLENALSDKPRAENVVKKRWLSLRMSLLEELKLELADEGRTDIDVKELKDIVSIRLKLPKAKPQPEAPKKITFMVHYREFVARHSNARTREIYNATISRMEAFAAANKDVPRLESMAFEDVTVAWLHKFDEFLSLTSPKKNARNIHFRNIRAVIKDAFKADLTSAHPFDRFSIKPEPTKKRALPIDQLRALFTLEVRPCIQKYLDFARLSFLLMGINVIDLCHAEELVDGRLDYIRAKTHKPLSVKIEPEAMAIISEYKGNKRLLSFVENYANYRHFYNNLGKALKEIREALGLKELTSYWMRHSWATIAASLDIPKETIAHALSQGNYSVTDIYIDYDMKKVDAANRKVIDWVLYGKC